MFQSVALSVNKGVFVLPANAPRHLIFPSRKLPLYQPLRSLPGTSTLDLGAIDKEDLPGYLALVGYAAQELSNKFAMSESLLYASLAVYALTYTVLSVLNNRFENDRVAQVIAPAFLASGALGFFNGHLTAFQTASACFGFFLAKTLPGPLPVWLATLAYAIYSGHAAEWTVGVFVLSAALSVLNSLKSRNMPAIQQIIFLAFGGWAFYKQACVQVALLIMGGHVLTSTIS